MSVMDASSCREKALSVQEGINEELVLYMQKRLMQAATNTHGVGTRVLQLSQARMRASLDRRFCKDSPIPLVQIS